MGCGIENSLKDGLSGIMRVKNESRFISDCIDSCIDALDELIVVYNDCTDETPAILEQKQNQYPGKLRVYKYEYNVLSFRLSREDFDYAMSLPEDSPRLFCNQCNFLLGKVRCKYAMIIDADQMYFADELKKWQKICAKEVTIKWQPLFIIGWLFMKYFTIYRKISSIYGKPCIFLLSKKLIKPLYYSYRKYAEWRLQKGNIAISFSGLNLFKDDDWYVPFDSYNINPPYNGEGDHLIFKISKETVFSRTISVKLHLSVNEKFNHPYRLMYGGLLWFHLHANKDYCEDKVREIKRKYPNLFVSIQAFLKMSYEEVHCIMDKKVHTLYQRTLFVLVHNVGMDTIKRNLWILQKIKL